MFQNKIVEVAMALQHIVKFPHKYRDEFYNIFYENRDYEVGEDIDIIDNQKCKILLECERNIKDKIFYILYYCKDADKKYLITQTKVISRDENKYEIKMKEYFDDLKIAVYNFLYYSGIIIHTK